ncbi:indole-3-glycerol phosphate synthase TrpC [Lichenicoccus sp.]|uniref:indole-3-glycerol phosphate synthase TrpC n=1 Tax=Lichenicoccus sp. TaxID=2781899 RepID=UPI003D107456
MANDASDTLARICAQTRADVAERSLAVPLKELRARVRDQADVPRPFAQALQLKTAQHEVGLVAEIKQASPSAGLIRANFDPAAIARDYEAAGAACLSVLTEGPSFKGDLEHLRAARSATGLPVLRKDFILQDWQVFESRAAGADCILLIMAALGDDQASDLLGLARALDLDVLVEVHDEAELHRALALPASLIGINNRNLRTLRTDLATTIQLAPLVPPDRIIVAESGIATRADVLRLAAAGASCFLVGESLLRQPDCRHAAAALLGPL